MTTANVLKHCEAWSKQMTRSLSDLTRAARLTPSAVHQWRRVPSTVIRPATLRRLSEVMGCTVDELRSPEPIDFAQRAEAEAAASAPSIPAGHAGLRGDDRLFAAAVIMGTMMAWDRRDPVEVAQAAAAGAAALVGQMEAAHG